MKHGIPITKEMYQDWIGPDGYSDFEYGNHRCVPYRGGYAIFTLSGDDEIYRFASTCWDDGCVGSTRRYCPEFSAVPKDFDPNAEDHFSFPEPEFSLDEIHIGQELIDG